MYYDELKYGFVWGPVRAERLIASDEKGWVTLGISTKKVAGMQIYVTKTGKVRIHDERGEWTPPPVVEKGQ